MATTEFSLNLKNAHYRVVDGVIQSWDPKSGLVFTQKKARSSRRVVTHVPADDVVFFTGKPGQEGTIGYVGESIQPAFEDVEGVKHTSGAYHTGVTKKGEPITFSISHLSMTSEVSSEKKVRGGKLKKGTRVAKAGTKVKGTKKVSATKAKRIGKKKWG